MSKGPGIRHPETCWTVIRTPLSRIRQQPHTSLCALDFMRQFFQQFSEAASEFQHDPMSSFSRIFLPRRGAAEKLDDAQQSLVPVLQEKETKQDEVQPQKTGCKPKMGAVDREVVKDLMKAVRDNGLGSPYFKQLLKGTFNIYELTPFDLKSLASMILTDSQFIIWEAKWRKALNELRDKYQGGANAGLTVAQLAGDAPLDSPARQARVFPREVLTDIKNAARKAMVQIPPTGVTESSFTDIKQVPSESFTSFVDCLTQAVDRKISDEGVKPHLIRCLAFANANPECKRVISAMPGQPSMAEMIEACSKVGTPQHVATILGDQVEKAVKDAFVNFQQRQCYKCGKQGHFKKDCPEFAEIASSLDACPRVGGNEKTLLNKDFHFPNNVVLKVENHSKVRGEVPADWKLAKVAPVFKMGKKDDPENCSPVSLQCLDSILGQVFFNIFINDLDTGFKGILSNFANNIKLGGAVDSLEDREALQRDPDKSEGWTITNHMKLNKDGVREQNGPPVIQEEAVRELLRCLDTHKSMGADGIHPRVMRELADELAKPVSIIYQQSWLTGEVPDDWKLANVVAVHSQN
ncbi:hypothetical protein DUI87_01063 [Hirundo rustica rustica]|uniref:CCHC-type domain-containing protein n=1 Tax=Hirundo rustica rustica TaxID=333673 RepID=A0A3M0LMB2_HIRRU|nr:hypothetical protein DUI87_01063 [Hirundo rustica rustica]